VRPRASAGGHGLVAPPHSALNRSRWVPGDSHMGMPVDNGHLQALLAFLRRAGFRCGSTFATVAKELSPAWNSPTVIACG
jgi:hypothetical protein